MDLNSSSSSEKITQINNCDIIYFIYFIILIAIIYLIYKFIYSNNYIYNTSNINEHFNYNDNNSNNILSTNNLTKSNVCNEITGMLGQELKFNNIKEKINNRIKEHDNAVYISTWFDKINPKSLDIDKSFDNNYPKMDLANKKIITNQIELNQLINQTNTFKNIYQPGDIVNSSSSFNIDKNKICDLENNKQYSNCMVCAVNKPDDWVNSKTKTNIKNVCLFSNKPGLGINSIDDCKKLCNITNL